MPGPPEIQDDGAYGHEQGHQQHFFRRRTFPFVDSTYELDERKDGQPCQKECQKGWLPSPAPAKRRPAGEIVGEVNRGVTEPVEPVKTM